MIYRLGQTVALPGLRRLRIAESDSAPGPWRLGFGAEPVRRDSESERASESEEQARGRGGSTPLTRAGPADGMCAVCGDSALRNHHDCYNVNKEKYDL